jgi:hypothetical protein
MKKVSGNNASQFLVDVLFLRCAISQDGRHGRVGFRLRGAVFTDAGTDKGKIAPPVTDGRHILREIQQPFFVKYGRALL